MPAYAAYDRLFNVDDLSIQRDSNFASNYRNIQQRNRHALPSRNLGLCIWHIKTLKPRVGDHIILRFLVFFIMNFGDGNESRKSIFNQLPYSFLPVVSL